MFSKIITPGIWILGFFLMLFLYTKFAGPIPFAVNSVTTSKSTTFDVSGAGKVTVKPDIAAITAGITVTAPTAKGAQDQINSVINKVSNAVKKEGVDAKDIQTTNYSIHPDYDYTSAIRKVTNYSANANLLIKVRNLDNINNVIDTTTANGANTISGLNFGVDDKTKVENEARQKAVAEAKEKAQQAAKIAGFKLGRIINYSENSNDYPRAMMLSADAAAKPVGGTATQVEAGSEEITVNVTLSYQID